MEGQTHTTDVANEPIAGVIAARNSVDGLMAYIMSVSPSVNTRRILGQRLLEEAKRDAEHLKHKVENQIRELGARTDWPEEILVKPSGFAVRNAISIIEGTPNATFLEKIAPYPTDHATVMLKWIVGSVVATVDAGKDRFTYAIIDTVTAEGLSGEGSFKGSKDIEQFYSQFQTAIL